MLVNENQSLFFYITKIAQLAPKLGPLSARQRNAIRRAFCWRAVSGPRWDAGWVTVIFIIITCSQDEAAISMLENNVGLLAEPFEEIVPKMDETLGNLMKGLLITVEDESREEQEFDLDTHAQDCTIL